MSEKIEYIRYSEFCDNEGETWHRFIPLTVNGETNTALDNFRTAVDKVSECYESDGEESPYWFCGTDEGKVKLYSQAHVDVLLEENSNSNCGYHEEYGISNIKDLNMNISKETDNFEHFDSQIYKLQWEK
jgi:hypothetical protein